MKSLLIALTVLLVTSPALAQTSPAGPLLAHAPTQEAPAAYIQVKQASYGPFWGKYRSLLEGVRSYCGDESSLCQVYCPKSHKACWVVYSCGEHITKSLQVRSGDLIVMDCRKTITPAF